MQQTRPDQDLKRITGPAGPMAGVSVVPGPARGMTCPSGPTGPVGPTGPTGPAGAIAVREVHNPSKEGRLMSTVKAGDGLLEIYARSSSAIAFGIMVKASVSVYLRDSEGQRIICSWDAQGMCTGEPDEIVGQAVVSLEEQGVPVDRDELSREVEKARKAAMRMMAAVCAELLVSHVGRDEMGEVWDEANALRVMAG